MDKGLCISNITVVHFHSSSRCFMEFLRSFFKSSCKFGKEFFGIIPFIFTIFFGISILYEDKSLVNWEIKKSFSRSESFFAKVINSALSISVYLFLVSYHLYFNIKLCSGASVPRPPYSLNLLLLLLHLFRASPQLFNCLHYKAKNFAYQYLAQPSSADAQITGRPGSGPFLRPGYKSSSADGRRRAGGNPRGGKPPSLRSKEVAPEARPAQPSPADTVSTGLPWECRAKAQLRE